MFGSVEAAKAIFEVQELEYNTADMVRLQAELVNPPPDPYENMPGVQPLEESIREQIEQRIKDLALASKGYKEALAALKAAFPSVVCREGQLCECGWQQAPWPWIAHRPGGPFCDCHMEQRAAWMKEARRQWRPYYCMHGPDLGHHLYPNSGPQRGPGGV